MRKWIICLLLMGLLIGCGGERNTSFDWQIGEPARDTTDDPIDYQGLKPGSGLEGAAGAAQLSHERLDDGAALLVLVNEVRCDEGLNPLTLNAKLNEAGFVHSVDMVAGDYFDHLSPTDDSDPGLRVAAQGYEWSAVGENIAAGYPDVQAVFDGWMASEGHRENILSADFHEMGLGHIQVTGNDYLDWWTQVFGRPWEDQDAAPAVTCTELGF